NSIFVKSSNLAKDAAPDDDDDKWLTKLNTCKWLKFVSKALHGAASLAKLLDFTNIELVGKKKKTNSFKYQVLHL
ncbi:unnamed protein product, partial [Rotaria sordida]